MTAQVFDLAVVRGALARAVPVEAFDAVAPLSLDQINAEVAAIRAELVRPLQRLARLRAAGAHLTAGYATWHEAVEAWLGDLSSLRLSGSAEAVAERDALVWSMREAGLTTRPIRERLGVSSYAVNEALRRHDPAPEVLTASDGKQRTARTGRAEVLAAPTGRVYEQAAEWLRRSPAGLTLAELAGVAGWSEGKASGALSDCRRRGTAERTEERRAGMRVHVAVVEEEA